MTTRPLPLEKEMGINSILCEPASDGLPESFLRRPANIQLPKLLSGGIVQT
jgi:hypothetical protein